MAKTFSEIPSRYNLTLNGNIKLTRKNDLGRQIIQDILRRLNNEIPDKLNEIKVFSNYYIEKAIKESSTYNSLLYGPLDAHFGLTKPIAKESMDEVIAHLQRETRVNFSPFKLIGNQSARNIKGAVEVIIIGQDNPLRNLIRLPSSSYPSSGGPVDWLQWLLFEGSQPVVLTHHIKFGNFPNSRTGQAYMVPGGTYSVPLNASGVENYNFITRALEAIQEEWNRVFQLALKRIQ